MGGVIYSEWIKLRSLRSTAFSLLAAVVIIVGLGTLFSALRTTVRNESTTTIFALEASTSLMMASRTAPKSWSRTTWLYVATHFHQAYASRQHAPWEIWQRRYERVGS